MNLKYRSIADKGTKNERIILEALLDIDIGRYVVFQNQKGVNANITNVIYNSYWLPDKKVKAGDLIVLYTRGGSASSKINSNGNEYHFIFWGLPEPIWHSPNRAPVILSIAEWESY